MTVVPHVFSGIQLYYLWMQIRKKSIAAKMWPTGNLVQWIVVLTAALGYFFIAAATINRLNCDCWVNPTIALTVCAASALLLLVVACWPSNAASKGRSSNAAANKGHDDFNDRTVGQVEPFAFGFKSYRTYSATTQRPHLESNRHNADESLPVVTYPLDVRVPAPNKWPLWFCKDIYALRECAKELGYEFASRVTAEDVVRSEHDGPGKYRASAITRTGPVYELTDYWNIVQRACLDGNVPEDAEWLFNDRYDVDKDLAVWFTDALGAGHDHVISWVTNNLPLATGAKFRTRLALVKAIEQQQQQQQQPAASADVALSWARMERCGVTLPVVLHYCMNAGKPHFLLKLCQTVACKDAQTAKHVLQSVVNNWAELCHDLKGVLPRVNMLRWLFYEQQIHIPLNLCSVITCKEDDPESELWVAAKFRRGWMTTAALIVRIPPSWCHDTDLVRCLCQHSHAKISDVRRWGLAKHALKIHNAELCKYLVQTFDVRLHDFLPVSGPTTTRTLTAQQILKMQRTLKFAGLKVDPVSFVKS